MAAASSLSLSLCGEIRAAGSASQETNGGETATVELKGLLVPLNQANISSRSTGVIKEMKREGNEVKQGDVVVLLDNDLEKLSVQSAQAVLEVREYEEQSTAELQGKGSESKSNLKTAEANLKTARIQLDQAKVTLDKKTVYAPFEGVVTRDIRSVGEAVDNYLPLLTMVDLSKVYLETYLPANRLGDVQPGAEVEVRVPDLPGHKWVGKVEFIAPVIDPASGEFRMKIVVPNDDRLLRSGMTAVGRLELNHRELHADSASPAPPSKRPN